MTCHSLLPCPQNYWGVLRRGSCRGSPGSWDQDLIREIFSGFHLAPGETKCFSHLWVVRKMAERPPTWKASGLGWRRKGSDELTFPRLCSQADHLLHTRVDGGQHLDLIPWHVTLLLLPTWQAQRREINWLKWPSTDWNEFSASWKSECLKEQLSWCVQR